MKLKYSIGFILAFCMLFLFTGLASADANSTGFNGLTSVTDSTYLENEAIITPMAEVPEKYPGTNITVQAGDIIFNPKSISTFLAGHVGIVGGSATLSWTEKIRACRINLSSEGAEPYNAQTTTTYVYSRIQKANGSAL